MLSHPNIVSYYDSFDEDGILWIEMEYADGGYVVEAAVVLRKCFFKNYFVCDYFKQEKSNFILNIWLMFHRTHTL